MTDGVIEITASMPDVGTRQEPVTLPKRQWLLYGVARKHLIALATCVPATSPIDYWVTLQHLDALHDPLARPTVEPLPVVDKRVHYVTARLAMETLAEFYLRNPAGGRAAVEHLDREWAKDPDHGDTHVPTDVTAVVRGA